VISSLAFWRKAVEAMECADTSDYRRNANRIVNLTLTAQTSRPTGQNAPAAWTLQSLSCKEKQGARA
jgi:hypothetical protein